MNWFERHLNYSWILLSLIGTLLIALILNLFVDVVWQPGLFGGFAFAPFYGRSDFLVVLEYPLNMAAPLTVGGWVLRQKGRSLWWLLIIFVPIVGTIVFLFLKNRSEWKGLKVGETPRLVRIENEGAQMGKKCPYCGRPLHNTAFKCARCNKWVDNEVFRRLCEDDVKLIKDKDLTPFTPTLLAMMVIDLLKQDNSLEQAIQKWQGKKLNEIQRFNLMVFHSFCCFNAVSFAKMKQGRRDTIKETLRVAFLQGVAELFNKRVKHAPPLEVLVDRGKALYAKFQAILDELGTDASSQLRASNAFGAIVFADDSPISFTGLSLYTHFMETFKNMGKEFSKMFLVEEEDFDWRAIAGT